MPFLLLAHRRWNPGGPLHQLIQVSMPLVYGEGARAFTRLQEEIIKETNDLTLFAWQAEAGTLAKAPYWRHRP